MLCPSVLIWLLLNMSFQKHGDIINLNRKRKLVFWSIFLSANYLWVATHVYLVVKFPETAIQAETSVSFGRMQKQQTSYDESYLPIQKQVEELKHNQTLSLPVIPPEDGVSIGMSACDTNETFFFDTSIGPSSIPRETSHESASTVYECCRACEQKNGCTFWTFRSSSGSCQMRLYGMQVTMENFPSLISGRVSLDRFIDARLGMAKSGGQKKTIYECLYEDGDLSYFENAAATSLAK